MIKEKLEKMKMDELHSIYGILSDLCRDYSVVTDNYALATGDSRFQKLPDAMEVLIKERQEFFSYREIVKDILKDKIRKKLNE